MPERLRTLRHCIFTGRGRKGKRHLQCRFLRKRGAAGQLPLPVTAPPVKIAFGALRRVRQTRNKNNLSAIYAQSAAERILNRPHLPGNTLSEGAGKAAGFD